jgi:hypothetical protein
MSAAPAPTAPTAPTALAGARAHFERQLDSYSKQLADVASKLMDPSRAVSNEDIMYNFAIGFGSALETAPAEVQRDMVQHYPRLLALEYARRQAAALRSLLSSFDTLSKRCLALEAGLAAMSAVPVSAISDAVHKSTQKEMLQAARA